MCTLRFLSVLSCHLAIEFPIVFTLFGIYELSIEDGAVFGYTFCKGEKTTLYLEVMKMELENWFGVLFQIWNPTPSWI